MKALTLNIIGKKSDFLNDVLSKSNRGTKNKNRVTIDRSTNLEDRATPHRCGCQCESCEEILYYNLDLSRT